MSEPTTKAGRRLLEMLELRWVDEPTNRGMADREWVHATAAIEAEARTATLASVREAVLAAGMFQGCGGFGCTEERNEELAHVLALLGDAEPAAAPEGGRVSGDRLADAAEEGELRARLWEERSSSGGLGAKNSVYELGWHAGFGDAFDARTAALARVREAVEGLPDPLNGHPLYGGVVDRYAVLALIDAETAGADAKGSREP